MEDNFSLLLNHLEENSLAEQFVRAYISSDQADFDSQILSMLKNQQIKDVSKEEDEHVDD